MSVPDVRAFTRDLDYLRTLPLNNLPVVQEQSSGSGGCEQVQCQVKCCGGPRA